MTLELWIPDSARKAAYKCELCGAEFSKGEEQGFGRHMRECSNDRADQMMSVAAEIQADGFRTGFDKERIKYERDRGRRQQ
jgi:hypothetical protein